MLGDVFGVLPVACTWVMIRMCVRPSIGCQLCCRDMPVTWVYAFCKYEGRGGGCGVGLEVFDESSCDFVWGWALRVARAS